MISTTNNFALTCWYKVPCCDKKFKALLFDISNGRATFLTESGQFLTDRIEYITVDGAAGLFDQCKWIDGEDKCSDQSTDVLNTCDNCNYAREVTMLDGSRITVCDGQSGEMVQVNADDTCDDCEPVVTEHAREED